MGEVIYLAEWLQKRNDELSSLLQDFLNGRYCSYWERMAAKRKVEKIVKICGNFSFIESYVDELSALRMGIL